MFKLTLLILLALPTGTTLASTSEPDFEEIVALQQATIQQMKEQLVRLSIRNQELEQKIDHAIVDFEGKLAASADKAGRTYVTHEGLAGLLKAIETKLAKLAARIESIANRKIHYRAHAAYLGWMEWVTDGSVAGTTGQSREIQAVQIQWK